MTPVTSSRSLFRSRRFQAVASIVLAIGLLAFFLSRVPLAEIGRRLADVSPGWLAASVVLSLFVFVLRAVRWIWILEPVGRVPFVPAFRATAIGFAANTVLPARAGEVLRPAILARERGLPFAALLASIVFERVLDALAQLLFLGIALASGSGTTRDHGLGPDPMGRGGDRGGSHRGRALRGRLAADDRKGPRAASFASFPSASETSHGKSRARSSTGSRR